MGASLTESAGTIRHASVAASSSGSNTLLAAPIDGSSIRVLAYVLVATSQVTAKFVSDTSNQVDLTGAMPLGDRGGVAAGWNPGGWFQAGSNKALCLVLGSGVAVAGHFTYQYVGKTGN